MIADVVVVGGGLAGSLAAWRLATAHPTLSLCLIESGSRLGGNHTWSFHDTDLPPAAHEWIAPLVAARWPRHEVRFPRGPRVLSGAYLAITSARLHEVIAPALGHRLKLEAAVTHLGTDRVTLKSGEEVHARVVIDARGAFEPPVPVGWQTFVGQEFELEDDHGMEHPILMDATVPQVGGFRFIYVLPWTARRVLVEDTLYADTPTVDYPACRRAIAEYVTRRGWAVKTMIREEAGALPIPLEGSGESFWPDAVATADLLAGMDLGDRNRVYQSVKQVALGQWRQRAFFRLLNRLLFRAARPAERFRVLEQFYRRPEPLIARFYAGRVTWPDRVRVLAGRPPVPITRALAHLLGK